MAFDNVRMDPRLSVGFTAILDWGTQVVKLQGGGEERVATRQQPARRWVASKTQFNKANVEQWRRFVLARRGAFHSFRFFDWSDYTTAPDGVSAPSMVDQLLGYGDGTTTRFPLRVQYPATGDLAARQAVRDEVVPIHGEVDARLNPLLGLPAATTLNILAAKNGVSETGFALDFRARDLVFTVAPALDVAVTMGCYFDNVVRLGEEADEGLEIVLDGKDHVTIPDIPIVALPFDRILPEADDPGGWLTDDMVVDVYGAKAKGKFYELKPTTTGKSFFCEDPNDVGGGGPHYELWHNGGAVTLTVRDHLGTSLGTMAQADKRRVLLKDTGTTKSWILW